MTPTQATEHKEVISPEGVEERLVKEVSFTITLTGGGKYRTYQATDGRRMSLSVQNTEAEAKDDIALAMGLMGMFLHDPKGAMQTIKDSLKKRETP